jgi:hypothetical protein
MVHLILVAELVVAKVVIALFHTQVAVPGDLV